MIYTENYQLRKPVIGVDNADVNDLNYNSDRIDTIMHSSQISLADAYDLNSTYNTGDKVMYEMLMYKCKEDGVTGSWDASKWERTTAVEGSGGSIDFDIFGEGSGSVVTITDGAEAGLAECIAEIEATQSGSGTPSPSNVRPISGWSEVNVSVSGKNLSTVSTGSNNVVVAHLKANTTYTFSIRNQGNCGFNLKKNSNTGEIIANQDLSTNPVLSKTITPTEDMDLYLNGFGGGGYTFATSAYDYQLEIGSTATEYEPYNGSITTIPLGRTVYGGTLDITRRILTVDKGFKTYTGDADENWAFSTDFVYINISDALRPPSTIGIRSNIIATATARDEYTGFINQYGNLIIYVPSSITSASDWKTWLSSNNMQIEYKLATPQTYTITTEEISTILGYNNISADSGDVSVVYVKQTAPIKPNPTGADIPLTGLEISGKDFVITDARIPAPPTTNGAYVLTVTVSGGTPTYSWENA